MRIEPKQIQLVVSKAIVLLRTGTDLVSLEVDKPSPFPPEVSTQPLSMSFEVRANHGVEYCRANFGVEPEVIDARTHLKRVPYSR